MLVEEIERNAEIEKEYGIEILKIERRR